MEIRPLTDRADVSEAARAHHRSWRVAYDGLVAEEVLADMDPADAGSDATVDEWLDRLPDPPEFALAAAVDGAVQGFADFRWVETKPVISDGDAELKAIYADPDYWGEGIGTALLAAGIERLPERFDALSLVTFAENDVGRRFYEANGFERVDTGSTDIAGETYDTVVYRRSL